MLRQIFKARAQNFKIFISKLNNIVSSYLMSKSIKIYTSSFKGFTKTFKMYTTSALCIRLCCTSAEIRGIPVNNTPPPLRKYLGHLRGGILREGGIVNWNTPDPFRDTAPIVFF